MADCWIQQPQRNEKYWRPTDWKNRPITRLIVNLKAIHRWDQMRNLQEKVFSSQVEKLRTQMGLSQSTSPAAGTFQNWSLSTHGAAQKATIPNHTSGSGTAKQWGNQAELGLFAYKIVWAFATHHVVILFWSDLSQLSRIWEVGTQRARSGFENLSLPGQLRKVFANTELQSAWACTCMHRCSNDFLTQHGLNKDHVISCDHFNNYSPGSLASPRRAPGHQSTCNHPGEWAALSCCISSLDKNVPVQCCYCISLLSCLLLLFRFKFNCVVSFDKTHPSHGNITTCNHV